MDVIKMLGKFIKRERAKKKLSLAQLSKLAFGSPHQAKSISSIERGLVPNVPFANIDKILVVLGYDLKELFKVAP